MKVTGRVGGFSCQHGYLGVQGTSQSPVTLEVQGLGLHFKV